MNKFNGLTILAIETSCDDTCIAVLKVKVDKKISFEVLSNIISSQVKIHAKYGGVYPMLAKREHQKNLPFVLKKALKKAGYPKIDLVALTVGPGLEPCLWMGVNFSKEVAKKLKLPLVPVNHIEAHILANFTKLKFDLESLKKFFPAVCLVVSGGHTQLILMKDFGDYKILGETRDDAAGECFDKIARILGLGYPGGPVISKKALNFKSSKGKTKITLPRPMIHQKNYDFSFSGLKTAVLYDFKSQPKKTRKSKNYVEMICYEAQQAIIDVLIHKTIKAAKDYGVKSIILGGGVASNNELKKQLAKKIKKEIPNSSFLVPSPDLCTDNAVMIAVTGFFRFLLKNKNWKKIEANANLRIDKTL